MGECPTCQNIEANVCQYFFEGEVQVRWVFSSILQGGTGSSSTGSVIVRICGFVGVGSVGNGDWVEFV